MNSFLLKIVGFISCLLGPQLLRAQEPSIIPQPVSLVIGKGSFVITPSTTIKAEGNGLTHSVYFLNDYLQRFYGFTLGLTKQA